jgi:serine phosphatase RsbU (regulator of sigma subunit)
VLYLKYSGISWPFVVCDVSIAGQIEGGPGIVLGRFDGVAFETRQLQFNPGDWIALYTNFVTEAMNAAQEIYEEVHFFEFPATN